MIGLDTNVLLRLALRDDADQYDRVLEFVNRELVHGRKGYVNLIVLLEFAWTLERAYGFGRERVLAAVRTLLEASNMAFERQETVSEAVAISGQHRIDLSDVLISEINRKDGCDHTVTFDRAFIRSGMAVSVT